MKNDLSFKLVTLIVFAGVLVAFFSPAHPLPNAEGSAPEIAHTMAAQTE
jgi:hypothetical protein